VCGEEGEMYRIVDFYWTRLISAVIDTAATFQLKLSSFKGGIALFQAG